MTETTYTPPPPPPPKAARLPPYKHITRYDLGNGKLLGIGQVAYTADPEIGQGFLAGHYDINTKWYDGNTVVERQPLGASLSSAEVTLGDEVTLSPLPIPCTAFIDGIEPVHVDDGSLEITAQSIGEAFRVVIDEPGYLRESFTFSVIDS